MQRDVTKLFFTFCHETCICNVVLRFGFTYNQKHKIFLLCLSYLIECLSGTFGVNCSSECHCNNNSQCNKETGNCGSSGCAPGWTEHNCSEGKNTNLIIVC